MTDPTFDELILTDLSDHMILIPDFFNGDWIVLGEGIFCSAKLEGLGSPELRANETPVIGTDGVTFGREYFSSRKWTITGIIKTGALQGAPGTPEDAWDALSKLMRVWDQYPGRTEARTVIPLYWKRPGRPTVLLYGRPERIDPDVSLAYAGFIRYTAVFRQSDYKYYDAEESGVTASVVASVSGGLKYNTGMTALFASNGKLQTTLATGTVTSVIVDGEIDTNPIITFYGPVLNPYVTVYNEYGGELWTVKVETVIGENDWVRIDTRVFARTAYSRSGTNVAGFLRSPALKDVLLPAGGEYQVSYKGQDVTNTSTCELRFRNAWATV